MPNARTLEILDRLIAFPTVPSASNLDLIAYVDSLLRASGAEVTTLPAPEGDKAGLVAHIGPRNAGGVCLSAHSDVVPVEGQNWTVPPFALTRSAGRLHGRGTTDMKGFLAAALATLEKASRQNLRVPLSLCLSYDEEVGCVGLRQMLPRLASLLGEPRVIIVGEPTGLRLATGHKGKTAFEATCYGASGHSAMAPNFTNALHVAVDLVAALRAWQTILAQCAKDEMYAIPYSTVHVGRLSGGTALNVVPARASVSFEVRALSSLTDAEILAKLEEITAKLRKRYPDVPPADLSEVTSYPGLNASPHSETARWLSTLVPRPDPLKVAFGTEAGFFADMGRDCFVVGPGQMDRDGHQPDEGLDEAQLAGCEDMLDRVLDDLIVS